MTEIALGSLFVIALVTGLSAALLFARRLLIPQEAVAVVVNGGTRIEAGRGDQLLAVLHGAGIAVPAACGGAGTCGLCRVAVEGPGLGEPQATELGILSPAERREHLRLACQTKLRGSVDVTVAADVLAAESFPCKVLSNCMLAPLIRELTLELPQGREFRFRAGGFAQLTAPAYSLDFAQIEVDPAHEQAWRIAGWPALKSASPVPVTRAYSIASRPQDAGRIVFNIRLAVPPAGREHDIPPGIVSSWLFSLKPGDMVQAGGPFGEFFVQPSEREMVFIGGGVGMAPLRAMIHEQIGLGTKRKMSFFYGARAVADLFYVEEFEAIAATHENFSWTPALSDPAPSDRWTGETGFIHETVRKALAGHPAPDECEFYLCGPPVMISAVLAMLHRLGVEPHSIYNDDFGG
ncbi:NADH:ubiquinone reductase (Na(+)-transporting) subunit F [Aquamicrobium segne]|uniref:Na(+)-translocating NADH-quinone reductase subunit F n=1 Tax=Aquamicrobium segne TaxID=469547 RepID=A0ABW0H022_9HYPH